MKNKKAFEFSFGWLFAMVVGAAILFLAIYAAVKLVGTERGVQETEAAKQLEIILTPVETGYEEGKSIPAIVFPTETRVYNNCSVTGNFGEQKIRVATSMNLGKTWQEAGEEISSYNKYIFSSPMVQGKELYVFSKPFEMPFKVANLLFMWTSDYCFVDPPNEIESEVTSLGLKKINVTTSDKMDSCKKGAKKVCFASEVPACDIIVKPINKYVNKKGRIMYYEGSLIYGAIFSEPELYECQVKRLMKRTSELALLYDEKSKIISARAGGCSSELQADLESLALLGAQLNRTEELSSSIYFLAEGLREKNEMITSCKLWED